MASVNTVIIPTQKPKMLSTKFYASFALAFAASISLSGCSTAPATNYAGEDAALLVFTVTSSSSAPPTLWIKHVDEEKPTEIVFNIERDKILAAPVNGSNARTVGIIRRLRPGAYVLTGAGLGVFDSVFYSYKEFKRPYPVKLLPREVNYVGSYRMEQKAVPGTAQTNSAGLTTIALADLRLEYSLSSQVKSDIEALSLANPELRAMKVNNVTPLLDESIN